jgi:hypothetical protein
MSNDSIARVHYFQRQFLRTGDFRDEQAYHLEMGRRHNIAHHIWGIVRGLELVQDEGQLFLGPGLAVDGFGRVLAVTEKRALSTGSFVDKGSDVLDVWLVYDRVGTDQAPEGYGGCGDGDDASFYRWQERPLVRLDVPDPAFPNPRQPESVPVGDLDFGPSRTPPDDPEADWPVYLGQILRDPENPEQPFSVDLAGRPYVGLVGEAVVAPSGRARVQIGSERANDPRRFAVWVPADASDPSLEIDQGGQMDIRGETTIHGDLTMAGGAIELQAGQATSPQPWHVYHHQAEGERHSLRIEMAGVPAGGEAGSNQVVIGAWSAEEEAFKPCLTIQDDCTITVHGNLVVEGQIQEGADLVASRLSSEARRFLQSSYLSGVGGGSAILDRVYRSPYGSEIGITGPGRLMMAEAAVGPATETNMEAVAQGLAADEAQLTAFAELIKDNHPELAETLRDALETDEG